MDIEVSTPPPDIKTILSRYGRRPRGRWKQWASWLAIASLVAIAIFVFRTRSAPTTTYVTQEVTTGNLTVTVTATGNLEPRNQVETGSELSGTIRTVHVDVNDAVKQGQLLAVLDTTRLKAQLVQAESAVASAEARILQSDATLKEARANQARLLKVRELSGNRLPSQQDLDVAEAAVARAEGDLAASRAAVAQARATRETIQTDLSKAEIRSPIDGVVLVRSIEPGQTVAASFQAPVLFTLAEDLSQMELHVSVDEADVGAVKVGQAASFTVDAFPTRTFDARITRIHMASNNTRSAGTALGQPSTQPASSGEDVVTYETVLEVDNTDLLLRPGMTATAEIVTSSINGATLVPNAAMRFTPDTAQFPGMSDDSERGRGMMALMPYLAERWKCPREDGQALGCVWVLEKGKPALAVFKPGATDRSMTQVIPLNQLPRWSSLSRLRSDEVLTKAIERKLNPGTPVIVDSTQPPAK